MISIKIFVFFTCSFCFLQYCSHQCWMGLINCIKLFALSTSSKQCAVDYHCNIREFLHRKNSGAVTRTRAGWAQSKNATTVLCPNLSGRLELDTRKISPRSSPTQKSLNQTERCRQLLNKFFGSRQESATTTTNQTSIFPIYTRVT